MQIQMKYSLFLSPNSIFPFERIGIGTVDFVFLHFILIFPLQSVYSTVCSLFLTQALDRLFLFCLPRQKSQDVFQFNLR